MGRVLNANMQLDSPEFCITHADFKYIQKFMHSQVGIFIADCKQAMVYGRLSRKMRELDVFNFNEYQQLIETDPKIKMEFINALTTNKTHFFREYHHFEYLEQQLVPQWIKRRQQEVAIWSAGCSTGEEPYSIAASLNKCGAFEHIENINLLATDLDTNVLAQAKQGVYDIASLESIPANYLKSNFLKGKNGHVNQIKAKPCLCEHINFKQLNLLDKWPFDKQFDLISCRNVMIYFTRETQQQLIEHFCDHLKDHGTLFIGHSESVPSHCQRLKHLGKTIYIKV
ncbi:CheR family methyltransferase [Shewanella waksmanii]|uniref:CheR family methyltransferase n=1 Tax=Shewanella waksmanii TaxID=213783 RepID=UPI0037367BB1